jgi:FixJ family two-component response regulator
VAAHLIQGLTSRQIGKTRAISHRTVEIYRARLMRKYKAANAGDLVRKLMAGKSPFPHGECGLVKSNV